MIGRQVRFYMLPGDEQRFFDFVCQHSSTVLVARSSEEPAPSIIQSPPGSAQENVELRFVLLWNTSLPVKAEHIRAIEMKTYKTEQADYVETGEVRYFIETSNAPVVELDRCFIRDNGELAKGRIWAAMYRLEGDHLMHKESSFEAWYNRISQWLRRHGTRVKGVDGYLLPEAIEWHKRGRKLGR